ncbi:hypothetical protein [Phytohabitans kaempferiae]|uniref:Sigma-70 family RNA polymerase sigma factor n=1 Tax=Phytohabitans kaempferiae TaxID=1620943 RepID=A0ABV6M6B8_9ACTN
MPDTWSSKDKHPRDKTPLGIINRAAMAQLTLTVPSTLVDPSTPAVALPMIDLRARLLRGNVDRETKDRVWRHIGALAREHKKDWNLFALGMAYPGMRRRAWKWTEGLTFKQTEQFHYTFAIEFIAAMHRLKLDHPNVVRRFIGAAYDHATGRKRQPEPEPDIVDVATLSEKDWQDADRRRQKDPVSVLDRLVEQTRAARDGHRLTDLHATLIDRTYLRHEKLRDVAEHLDMNESNASKHRRRAEILIARLLHREDLITAATEQTPADLDPDSGS